MENGQPVGRKASTIDEFCDDHRLSRGMFYKLLKQGKAPRVSAVPRFSHSSGVIPMLMEFRKSTRVLWGYRARRHARQIIDSHQHAFV